MSPYANVPDEMQDKMESCVQKVMDGGNNKEAAIAICHTSVVEGKSLAEATKSFYLSEAFKAESLSGQVERVRNAFMYQFEMSSNVLGYAYIEEVFPAYVIACQHAPGKEEIYYKVGYSLTTDSVVFQPRDQWQEVEEVYQAKAMKAGRMISAKNKAALRQAIDIITSMLDDNPDMQDTQDMQAPMKSGNALKAISMNDEEIRVGNYIVLFGGKDLTGMTGRKNQDGSKGESFSKSVDVESEYTSAGVLHVDFEHSLDPDGLGIGRDDVLGYVDWKTAKRDERGIFVERVLNRRNKYVSWLKDLIDAGMIGNSSEAIAEKVEKKSNGEIVKWPLRRDTLTVNPMEPRMLSENAIAALKALKLEQEALPDFREIGRQIGAEVASQLQQFRQSAG